MEKKTFQQGMAYLAAAYGMELSKERAAVYWDQLGSLRDEPFMEAVRTAVNHGERFPTVAQLCTHYRDVIRRKATEHIAAAVPQANGQGKGKAAYRITQESSAAGERITAT